MNGLVLDLACLAAMLAVIVGVLYREVRHLRAQLAAAQSDRDAESKRADRWKVQARGGRDAA